MSQELKKEIYQKAKSLMPHKENNNWATVREYAMADMLEGKDPRYNILQANYFFGDRLCIVPKKVQVNEVLQASRGLSENSFEEITIEEYLSDIEKRMKEISQEEEQRVESLVSFLDNYDENWHSGNFGVCELGYRVPDILYYFKNKYPNCNIVRGYDINDLNIKVGKYFGFDTRKYDFNSEFYSANPNEILDLAGCKVVISYHMLEHLTEPLNAIQKIYNSMDHDSIFQVEIPIDSKNNNTMPLLKAGHLFAFQVGDLRNMIIAAGFKILDYNIDDRSAAGVHGVSRIIAIKC